MALDAQAVAAMYPQVVPMVGTLGFVVEEVTAQRAVMRFPDQQPYHNHLGGPHAGAMFTLGEAASGVLVLLEYGDRLEEVVPLAMGADIRYVAVAMGDVTATATTDAVAEDVLAQLAAGTRPEFDVDIVIATADGTVTGEMTVRWTLKPLRR